MTFKQLSCFKNQNILDYNKPGTEDSEKATACNRHVNTFQRRRQASSALLSVRVATVPRLRPWTQALPEIPSSTGNSALLPYSASLREIAVSVCSLKMLREAGLTMRSIGGAFEDRNFRRQAGLASEMRASNAYLERTLSYPVDPVNPV